MKKLINRPDHVVDEALAGLIAAHGSLIRMEGSNIVVRRGAPRPGKVGVMSGGGSGHEPMHAGFVGRGMLDAACMGAIFTSPGPDRILAATRAVDGGVGVLQIVKNYTGDVMNFGIAAELAQAQGMRVSSVTIGDDIAVKDWINTAGRRGVGGAVLAEKIVGAAAEEGANLETVTALCQRVRDSVWSMGMALTSCTVPAAGRPTFQIGEDEMEIGVGIHGEPGRRRAKLAPADEIVELLVGPLLDEGNIDKGDRVLVFVNGLGGTPLLELYIVFRKVAEILAGRGITISRSLVGNYVTSLDMAGTSISLLRLDDELTRLWDAPVHTPALRWGS